MNEFEVTIKRIAAFCQTITVQASNFEEAYIQANALSFSGAIVFDYDKGSDLIDEYIIEVEIVD